jgi:hypothetical protein
LPTLDLALRADTPTRFRAAPAVVRRVLARAAPPGLCKLSTAYGPDLVPQQQGAERTGVTSGLSKTRRAEGHRAGRSISKTPVTSA